MKRRIAFVMIFVCLLSLGSCGKAEPKERGTSRLSFDTEAVDDMTVSDDAAVPDDITVPDDAAVPDDKAAPDDTAASDKKPIGTAKEIKGITDNTGEGDLPCMEEVFFEDDGYVYIFGNPISRYVIVEYTDGSRENVKAALENGHIQITDLDTYGICYFAESKRIETIVDLTENGGIATAEALEWFFRDSEYTYYFPSIKSQYVTVYYKDGTSQNVKEALNEGKIKIRDLDWFGIFYGKCSIEG